MTGSAINICSGLNVVGYWFDYEDSIITDIVSKCYQYYKTNHISFVKVLGIGHHHIVFEIKIHSMGKIFTRAVRMYKFMINEDSEKITHVCDHLDENFVYIPRIEVRNEYWIITDRCYSFQKLFNKCIETKNLVAIDYLLYLYSKSIYKVVKYVHNKGYGIFDWKIDNYVVNTNYSYIVLQLCDIEFSSLRSGEYKYSHNIIGLYGDMKTLDIKIAIKEIHDVMMYGIKEASYDDLIRSWTPWDEIIRSVNKLNHPANKYINKLLSKIDYKYKLKASKINVNEQIINSIRNMLSAIDKEQELDFKNKCNKQKFDYNQLIEIPVQRILPQSIVEH